MTKEIWGPHLWHLLHTITFNTKQNFTNDDRIQIVNNSKNLGLGKSVKLGLKKAKRYFSFYLDLYSS